MSVPVHKIENDLLRVEVASSVGGRITSLVDKRTGEEWLWHHPSLPLRRVSPGTAEFLALTGLSAGWIGLRRAATGAELRLEFDRSVFSCCWFFASYGKLLGHYTAVLEPATSASLTVVGDPSPARLASGETLTTSVSYRLIQGES